MSHAAAVTRDRRPERLRVPLFARLIGDVASQDRVVVLDLGGCSHGMVNLLSAYQACLHVVDLPSSLGPLQQIDRDAADAERSLIDGFDALMPDLSSEPADLLLCWDLLNYFDLAALRALATALAPRLRPTARLHAVMEYASDQMPAEPSLWMPDVVAEPVDDPQVDHVMVGAAAAAQRAAPRYTPRQLEGLLLGFTIDSTMLLSNGMQEHLFKRSPNTP